MIGCRRPPLSAAVADVSWSRQDQRCPALVGIGAARPAAGTDLPARPSRRRPAVDCSLAVLALVGAKGVRSAAVRDRSARLRVLSQLPRPRGHGALGARDTADPDRRPAYLRGVAFGLTNPKSYPVALAMYALRGGPAGGADGLGMPGLFVASFVGFLCGDAILAWIVSTGFIASSTSPRRDDRAR